MIIVGHLLGFEGDTANTLVVIQLGSTRRGGDVLASPVRPDHPFRGNRRRMKAGSGRLSLIHILLGMIPRW